MVTSVFAHPPGVTDADDRVREDSRGVVVCFARAEHLTVGGFVRNERELRHDDGHYWCQRNLNPSISEKIHSGQSRQKRQRENHDQGDVVGARASEQTLVLDPGQEFGEL